MQRPHLFMCRPFPFCRHFWRKSLSSTSIRGCFLTKRSVCKGVPSLCLKTYHWRLGQTQSGMLALSTRYYVFHYHCRLWEEPGFLCQCYPCLEQQRPWFLCPWQGGFCWQQWSIQSFDSLPWFLLGDYPITCNFPREKGTAIQLNMK